MGSRPGPRVSMVRIVPCVYSPVALARKPTPMTLPVSTAELVKPWVIPQGV